MVILKCIAIYISKNDSHLKNVLYFVKLIFKASDNYVKKNYVSFKRILLKNVYIYIIAGSMLYFTNGSKCQWLLVVSFPTQWAIPFNLQKVQLPKVLYKMKNVVTIMSEIQKIINLDMHFLVIEFSIWKLMHTSLNFHTFIHLTTNDTVIFLESESCKQLSCLRK